jgi:hypothetical protein
MVMMGEIGIFGSGGTKVGGYGQHFVSLLI